MRGACPFVASSCGERGFSLIESIVALGVLSVCIFGTMQVFLGTMRTTSVASARTHAASIAAREIEAMRAIPYADIGFGASSGAAPSFEGATTVFVADAVAKTTPTSPAETAEGVSFAITRAIVWISQGSYTNQYKRVIAVVSWRDQAGLHSVRQDAFVYPGGLGPYGGATTTSTTTAVTPGAPSGLTATPDSLNPTTQINLVWTGGAPAATTFEVQHAQDSAFTTATIDTTTQPGTTTSFNKTGLAPGTTFYWRVRALNGTQSSAWSNTAQGNTQAVGAQPCTAGSANATPSAVKKKSASSNQLKESVLVTVNTTGACSGLFIRVTPQTTQMTQSMTQGSGGVWSTTIAATAYNWDVGAKTVHVVAGTNDVLASIALQICAHNAGSCP
jgi:prepilin-type N-terminal cleavage/methylation domain-containing protein